MALGHEAAGIVEETGPGVEEVSPGDRVVLVFVPGCGSCPECGLGKPAMCRRGAASNSVGELLRGGRRLSLDGRPVHHHLGVSAFSDYVVVDRRSAVVVPPDLPGDVAALFGCALLTGIGSVHNSTRILPGESMAVIGLGGVGLSAVLGAALLNAYPLVAIDPVPEKRDLALRLGASHALAPGDTLVDEVVELTHGGVDYAVEAVGDARVLETAFALTGRGGCTIAAGLPHHTQELRLPATRVVSEERTLRGSYMGSSSPQRDIPRLVGLWRAGRLPLHELIGSRVGLPEINRAMDELASGAATRTLVIPGLVR
jgi:alcohol dehydrogenase